MTIAEFNLACERVEKEAIIDKLRDQHKNVALIERRKVYRGDQAIDALIIKKNRRNTNEKKKTKYRTTNP